LGPGHHSSGPSSCPYSPNDLEDAFSEGHTQQVGMMKSSSFGHPLEDGDLEARRIPPS
jgi:hypothetical protein